MVLLKHKNISLNHSQRKNIAEVSNLSIIAFRKNSTIEKAQTTFDKV